MVCYDADSDTSYYINFGNDNYIYELKDDTSSLLINMEAICLQLWNNELYFLANNYKNKELLTGDLYCYNLANKELRLVLEADANFLYIDSYGIYFSQYELPQPDFLDTLQFTGYLLDFGTNTVQEVDYILPVAYNEYLLYVCNEGIVLHNRETNEKLLIAPEVYYYLNNFNFYDHYLIFTYNSKICILDLLNGEKKIYDFNDDKSLRYKVYFMDYMIFDNIFYGTEFSSTILVCNLSTGELDFYTYISYDLQSIEFIQALFTDGKRIYAIMHEYGYDRLVEVCLTDKKSISGRKIFEIKEMGK